MPEYSIKGKDGLTLCIIGPQNAIDRVEQLVKENDRLKAAITQAIRQHEEGNKGLAHRTLCEAVYGPQA